MNSHKEQESPVRRAKKLLHAFLEAENKMEKVKKLRHLLGFKKKVGGSFSNLNLSSYKEQILNARKDLSPASIKTKEKLRRPSHASSFH